MQLEALASEAWILSENRLYLSRFPVGAEAPSSAVLKLIQGLWEREGRGALRLLRHPIQTTHLVRDFERDFVKVAAKSVRQVAESAPTGYEIVEIGGDGLFAADFVRIADRDPVRAILRDEHGTELLRSESGAGKNRTLHAEVLLVQEWFRQSGKRLPSGATIDVSHKPCRMCAGLICHWSDPEKPVRVFYQHMVNGCRSRVTELDRKMLSEQRELGFPASTMASAKTLETIGRIRT